MKCETNHISLYSVEVRKAYSFTYTSPVLLEWCLGREKKLHVSYLKFFLLLKRLFYNNVMKF
jgi:hypothetical protein